MNGPIHRGAGGQEQADGGRDLVRASEDAWRFIRPDQRSQSRLPICAGLRVDGSFGHVGEPRALDGAPISAVNRLSASWWFWKGVTAGEPAATHVRCLC